MFKIKPKRLTFYSDVNDEKDNENFQPGALPSYDQISKL